MVVYKQSTNPQGFLSHPDNLLRCQPSAFRSSLRRHSSVRSLLRLPLCKAFGSTPGSAPDLAPGSAPDSAPGAAPGLSPGSAPGSAPCSAPGSAPGAAPVPAPGSAPG